MGSTEYTQGTYKSVRLALGEARGPQDTEGARGLRYPSPVYPEEQIEVTEAHLTFCATFHHIPNCLHL